MYVSVSTNGTILYHLLAVLPMTY